MAEHLMGAQGRNDLEWAMAPSPGGCAEAEAGSRKSWTQGGGWGTWGERFYFSAKAESWEVVHMLQDLQLHCAEGLMSAFHRVWESGQGGGMLGEMMGWISRERGGPTKDSHLSLLLGLQSQNSK